MLEVAPGLFSRRSTGLTWLGRRQLHTGTPGLRKTDRNRLLGGASTVLALTNVIHFFLDELSRLGRRRFAFPRVLSSAFQCLLFRHDKSPHRAPCRNHTVSIMLVGCGGCRVTGHCLRTGVAHLQVCRDPGNAEALRYTYRRTPQNWFEKATTLRWNSTAHGAATTPDTPLSTEPTEVVAADRC